MCITTINQNSTARTKGTRRTLAMSAIVRDFGRVKLNLPHLATNDAEKQKRVRSLSIRIDEVCDEILEWASTPEEVAAREEEQLASGYAMFRRDLVELLEREGDPDDRLPELRKQVEMDAALGL